MYFYLIGLIQEYCVIINLYNGDLINNLNEDLEYSLPDLLILIFMIYYHKNIDIIDWVLNILCLISHLQWYVHNPFMEWPDWWCAKKSENDIRHRTEYYDTHVLCFCIRLIIFIRNYDKKKNKTKFLNRNEINYSV